MLFTDFQKKIIRQISKNEVNDYHTLAKILFEPKMIRLNEEAYHVVVIIDEDDLPNARRKLLDYYIVVKTLERDSLLQIISAGGKASKQLLVSVINKNGTIVNNIDEISYNIVSEFNKKLIVASGELNAFISNSFKTRDERRDRLSKIIAYGSLFLSSLNLFASIYLTSNRKVEITNPGAFSEKIKVIIEKDSPTKK